MVELKFNVSDVDFESVIGALGGGIPAPMVMAARMMPDSAKEELVVKYINSNAGRLEGWLENALASKGVRMKITGAQAALKRS